LAVRLTGRGCWPSPGARASARPGWWSPVSCVSTSSGKPGA